MADKNINMTLGFLIDSGVMNNAKIDIKPFKERALIFYYTAIRLPDYKGNIDCFDIKEARNAIVKRFTVKDGDHIFIGVDQDDYEKLIENPMVTKNILSKFDEHGQTISEDGVEK